MNNSVKVKNQYKSKWLNIAFFIVVLLSFSCFLVKEAEIAFIVQFGKVRKIIKDPGLHFKIPVVDGVVYFDSRILQIDIEAKEIISLDQKRLIVDSYTKYRITDPSIFFNTLKNSATAEKKIASIVESSIRQIVASNPFVSLLDSRRVELMNLIKETVIKQTEGFGLEIVDVRILRADLPQKNSEAVFERMRTERTKEAKRLRAEGIEQSDAIKAKADMEAEIIIAEAVRESDSIRGKGEAEAAEIYSKNFSKDPEFYNFYRGLELKKKSLQSKNTKMIISDNSKFLDGRN